MKRKSIISIILVFALMFNLMCTVTLANTEETPANIEQSENIIEPVSDVEETPTETPSEDELPNTEEDEETPTESEEVPASDPEVEETETIISESTSTETLSKEELPNRNELLFSTSSAPVIVPTLAEGNTWYTNNTEIDKEAITKINIVDTYSASGTSLETPWDASAKGDGSVMCYVEESGSDIILTIAGNGTGKIMANSDSSQLFSGFYYASEINGLDLLDTSNVTNMSYMFYNCYSLTSLDVSNFDTSNVTDMSFMFCNIDGREDLFTELDVSNFDTSNVTKMGGMFSSVSNLKQLDVSNFDTSNVTDMGNMFEDCRSLTSLDLSNFNTEKVTYLGYMFRNCTSLASIDISSFNIDNVTSVRKMFKYCKSLTSLDLSNFNTERLNSDNALHMFAYGCNNLTSITFGENFGQNSHGGTDGLPNHELLTSNAFYVALASDIPTTVYGANDVMKYYLTNNYGGNRTITFVNDALETEETPNLESAPVENESTPTETPSVNETPSISVGGGGSLSGGGGGGSSSGGGGGGGSIKKETPTKTEDSNEDVVKDTITVKKNVENISYMALRHDNKFMPDEAATRYEIITALSNLFDIEKTDVIKEFKDVEKENAELVSLFSGADIINGYPDGTFGGDKGITRAEFIKILSIMLNLDETTTDNAGLNDINEHWAKDYITRFVSQGYIKGYPDGTFKPDNNITRAEAVTVINRIVKASSKNTLVSEDVSENHWAYEEIQNAIINNK